MLHSLFFTLVCFWVLGVQATESYTDKPQYWALLERLERLQDQYKFIEKIWLLEPSFIELNDPFHKIVMVKPSIFEDSGGILGSRKRPLKSNLAAWEVDAP